MINQTNYTEILLSRDDLFWIPKIVIDTSCNQRGGTGFDKTSVELFDDRFDWCKKNCKHNFHTSNYIFWFFEDLDDGMLFKITWL